MRIKNKLLLLALLCSSTVIQAQKVQVLLGDVDKDGEVSVTDLCHLIGYLNNMQTTLPDYDAADANQDYSIDVDDVSAITDIILKNEKKYIEFYEYNGHRCVDLGLGIKWATCNVGANKPEDCGDYFAWGETEPKASYNWSTYKWMTAGKASPEYITKYTIPDYQMGCIWYSGSKFVGDNKRKLDLDDDAAHVNWQGNWRMPTASELDNLRTRCTWTWIVVNGRHGYKVVGLNGQSIFLPATGFYENDILKKIDSYADYWSSTLDSDYSDSAFFIYFHPDYVYWYDYYRYYGQSIRAVCP